MFTTLRLATDLDNTQKCMQVQKKISSLQRMDDQFLIPPPPPFASLSHQKREKKKKKKWREKKFFFFCWYVCVWTVCLDRGGGGREG